MLSTDFSLPSFLEREKTQTVTMPVYENGPDPVAPSSGTFTLYDSNKIAIISAAAVTITSSIATYVITAASLPNTLVFSDEYMEEWVLTMPGGAIETIRRDAYLCIRSLYPVVNEKMLLRRVTDLASLKPSTIANWQGFIDEAWSSVQGMLLQDGKRPFLIMNSWALKDLHLALTLQYIFTDLSTYMGEGRYDQRASDYKTEAEEAYNKLRLEYDESQQNQRSVADNSSAARPVIYTNTPPYYRGTGFSPGYGK